MPNNNVCKICGLEFGDFYPWGEYGDLASFDICPCCGVEWGYEDCNEESSIRYRTSWINNGMNWFQPEKKPKNWNGYQQLQKIFEFK